MLVRSAFKDNFTRNLNFFRDVRGDEKVELARLKGGRIMPLAIPVKCDIAETAMRSNVLQASILSVTALVRLQLSFNLREAQHRLWGCRRKAYGGRLLLAASNCLTLASN